MKKILITGMLLPHVEKEIAALNKYAHVKFINAKSRDELCPILNDINVIMTDSTVIDSELLGHCPNLKNDYGVWRGL